MIVLSDDEAPYVSDDWRDVEVVPRVGKYASTRSCKPEAHTYQRDSFCNVGNIPLDAERFLDFDEPYILSEPFNFERLPKDLQVLILRRAHAKWNMIRVCK